MNGQQYGMRKTAVFLIALAILMVIWMLASTLRPASGQVIGGYGGPPGEAVQGVALQGGASAFVSFDEGEAVLTTYGADGEQADQQTANTWAQTRPDSVLVVASGRTPDDYRSSTVSWETTIPVALPQSYTSWLALIRR